MGVALFDSETVGVQRKGITELVSSASDSLELESRSIVEVPRSAEHSGTVSTANPDTPTRSPDPSP